MRRIQRAQLGAVRGAGNTHGSMHTARFQRRLHQPLPGRQFATAATVLDNRGVIRVDGADACTFLQGLTTNDTRLLSAAVEGTDGGGSEATGPWAGRCQYTSMLHPKGRVLWEFFAWAHPSLGDGALLLDCDAAALPQLQKRLNMFKLRAAVELTDVSADYEVLAVLGASDDAVASYTAEAAPGGGALVTADPRCAQI
eukprot:SAG22_NODE_7483_length_735_cov_1.451258_1_plen_197_part_10